MDKARIAELLQPFLAGAQPSETLLDHISTYIDLLLRWNARVNLTAIRDPESIVTRHFGESLFAARHLFPEPSNGTGGVERPKIENAAAEPRQSAAHGVSRREGALLDPAAEQRKKITLADVGSGAGFPGVPIKLWVPDVHVTLIESNNKKATFLRELARTLTLTNIDIQNTRAESLPEASFDIVTLRAVERFDTVLPIAAALIALGGHLALLVGARQIETAGSSLPSFKFLKPIPVPLSKARCLLIGRNP